MTLREQYEAAARQKQGLKNGTHAEEGPRAADSADHRLIAEASEALKLLETRPAPNGIGTCATDPREVARRIREAARLVSCEHCGRVYAETVNCHCNVRYEVDSAMLGEGAGTVTAQCDECEGSGFVVITSEDGVETTHPSTDENDEPCGCEGGFRDAGRGRGR